jgi:hypothetical protein
MMPIPRCFRTSRALRKRSFREDPGRADREKHDHPGQHACAYTASFFVCTVNRWRCIDSDRITEEAGPAPNLCICSVRPAPSAGPGFSPLCRSGFRPGVSSSRPRFPAVEPSQPPVRSVSTLPGQTGPVPEPFHRTGSRIPDPSGRLSDDSIEPAIAPGPAVQ